MPARIQVCFSPKIPATYISDHRCCTYFIQQTPLAGCRPEQQVLWGRLAPPICRRQCSHFSTGPSYWIEELHICTEAVFSVEPKGGQDSGTNLLQKLLCRSQSKLRMSWTPKVLLRERPCSVRLPGPLRSCVCRLEWDTQSCISCDS